METSGAFTEWAWCGIIHKNGKPSGSSTVWKWLQEHSRAMSRDLIQAYLNEIGRYPLLTKAQEVLLGTQVQAWMNILEKEEHNKEDLKIIKIGKKAKEKFINCNLRLVVNIARKYSSHCRTLDLMDLVQEGNIGLARAVEKFDPTRGYAMSTYAYWWIRQAIQRAIQTTDASIRLPVSFYDLNLKIKKTTEELGQRLKRQPTIYEIAEECQVDVDTLKMALEAPRVLISLDKKTIDNESGSIIELISDTRNSNTIEDAEARINVNDMYDAINTYLDEITKFVILERSKTPATTWKELSTTTGMSREKLQAIENAGIKRCALLIAIKKKIED